jgi:hypothetical protein
MRNADTSIPASVPMPTISAISPLWAFYASGAASGVAYWWMTRWAQPVNLEAQMAPAAPESPPEPAPEPLPEAEMFVAPEPGIDTIEVAAELIVAPEPVLVADEVALAEVIAATADLAPDPAPVLKLASRSRKAVAPPITEA